MTLPGSSLISAVDFKHYDVMPFTTTSADNLSFDHVYRRLQNANERSEQQANIAAMGQQQIMQQQIPQDFSTPLLPTLQEQNEKIPNSMSITAQIQPQELSQNQEETELPTATATASATIFSTHDLAIECVMPSIYLSKNFLAWNEENLRSHGFTHIIIIDKHIQELYYPSPLFKISTVNTTVDAFDTFEYFSHSASSSLKFGKEFEAIDLNFGEKSYLTTVLPNCYRAVKFINKALQGVGTLLIIDCNGSDQKCLTIVVAYLMYKHNINFSKAFARLKEYYEKADLDRFYMTQLYEYEPILQVQRAQSRGQSSSREKKSAILKRKKVADENEDTTSVIDLSDNYVITNSTDKNRSDFFNAFNPLTNFNTSTTTTFETGTNTTQNGVINSKNAENQHNQLFKISASHSLQQSSSCDMQSEQSTFEIYNKNNFNTCDDYAME